MQTSSITMYILFYKACRVVSIDLWINIVTVLTTILARSPSPSKVPLNVLSLQNSMHLSLHWSQLVDKRKQTTVFLECLLQSQSQQLSGIDRALLWTWIVLIWEQVKKFQ